MILHRFLKPDREPSAALDVCSFLPRVALRPRLLRLRRRGTAPFTCDEALDEATNVALVDFLSDLLLTEWTGVPNDGFDYQST